MESYTRFETKDVPRVAGAAAAQGGCDRRLPAAQGGRDESRGEYYE